MTHLTLLTIQISLTARHMQVCMYKLIFVVGLTLINTVCAELFESSNLLLKVHSIPISGVCKDPTGLWHSYPWDKGPHRHTEHLCCGLFQTGFHSSNRR
jgi:hypothetical protein